MMLGMCVRDCVSAVCSAQAEHDSDNSSMLSFIQSLRTMISHHFFKIKQPPARYNVAVLNEAKSH